MGGRTVPSAAGYAEAADALAKSYESIGFAEAQREVLHLMPSAPSRVLDIGAGTGRDAAALARMGHDVVAAEPTSELRAHGERLHADAAIEWIDEALPDLPSLSAGVRRFDLILLTAVWMHLDAAERAVAMESVARLLAPGGRILMSLRHGPVPPGRRMFDVSADETEDLARRHGLRPIHRSRCGDILGRPEVTWTYLGLERPRP
jgi:SAM-dependent methyltransferase